MERNGACNCGAGRSAGAACGAARSTAVGLGGPFPRLQPHRRPQLITSQAPPARMPAGCAAAGAEPPLPQHPCPRAGPPRDSDCFCGGHRIDQARRRRATRTSTPPPPAPCPLRPVAPLLKGPLYQACRLSLSRPSPRYVVYPWFSGAGWGSNQGCRTAQVVMVHVRRPSCGPLLMAHRVRLFGWLAGSFIRSTAMQQKTL